MVENVVQLGKSITVGKIYNSWEMGRLDSVDCTGLDWTGMEWKCMEVKLELEPKEGTD